jgi:hypothetical protein
MVVLRYGAIHAHKRRSRASYSQHLAPVVKLYSQQIQRHIRRLAITDSFKYYPAISIVNKSKR